MSNECDWEIIEGRPPVDVQTINAWCKRACGPELSDEDAARLAQIINQAMFEMPAAAMSPRYIAARLAQADVGIRDEIREKIRRSQEHSKSVEELWREIAQAVKLLQAKLPAVIADGQRLKPDADYSGLERLLAAADNQATLVGRFGRRKSHRTFAKALTVNLTRNVEAVWAAYPHTKATSVGAFVGLAMAWIGIDAPKDDTSRRVTARARTK
jgi:hypothetical protein